MAESEIITREEALAAVRRDAWTTTVAVCGHTGCEDHQGPGPRYVHCLSGFGMDIPLESVEEEIQAAKKVGWVDHWMDHDLAVITADEKIHYYAVKRPSADA